MVSADIRRILMESELETAMEKACLVCARKYGFKGKFEDLECEEDQPFCRENCVLVGF